MITDAGRINALEEIGNIAIWHGSWAAHCPEKGGWQIRSISKMDENGEQVISETACGESIREAIDNYIYNKK